ncbi:hypothetical protein SLEP1_g23855 [Rubroshorea leprosula]|uniref:Uncharacterized protein n=1 Tax=Rubroshorea leprosula TaxID=152421 RepID=A0AAV5JIW1_9ROSI|nr:hypothetical protein SLEP1_g23855 [Rubroshorea leprosula]
MLRLFAHGTWSDYKNNAGRLLQLAPDQVLKLKQLTVLTLAETNKVCYPDFIPFLQSFAFPFGILSSFLVASEAIKSFMNIVHVISVKKLWSSRLKSELKLYQRSLRRRLQPFRPWKGNSTTHTLW